MNNAAYLPSRETRYNTSRKKGKWKIIAGVTAILIAAAVGGLMYYQSTHFNAQITVNGVKIGGLTANQTLNKLQTVVLKNEVYMGDDKIVDGEDTKAGFTKDDLANIKELMKKQKTFFPSSKSNNYYLVPIKVNQYQSETLKNRVINDLQKKNASIKEALAGGLRIENGQLIVPGEDRLKEIDIDKTLKNYGDIAYKGTIHLNPVYVQPTSADNQLEKNKEKMLRDLIGRTVDYKVQDRTYSLKASEVIKKATVSNDMKYMIDTSEIKKKIDEINKTQATLNKNYTFKTSSGSVINVKGESYGWAINIDKETKFIEDAFIKGEPSLTAKNIYGTGWSTYGVGYKTTTNNGIGNSYVEVSINDQRIWVYKNGKLILTTNVVTGWKGVNNQDTPTGVWYINYKKSPSILRGSSFTHKNYASYVKYWAPFTLQGHGLHDANWRTDWSSDAYLTDGSNGCVNILPSVMKEVYDNIEQYEPVVIY